MAYVQVKCQVQGLLACPFFLKIGRPVRTALCGPCAGPCAGVVRAIRKGLAFHALEKVPRAKRIILLLVIVIVHYKAINCDSLDPSHPVRSLKIAR